jgi:hypothetical protein
MAGAYTYVEGASLTELILGVRDEFLARLPYELDETRRPNSVRLVTLDVFEGKTPDEQLDVLRDLLDSNPRLILARRDEDIFAYADTPAAYLTDLVCEVVWQVLARDEAIREEDGRRLVLSAESAAEMDEL